jgi:hypothetical protein
MIFSQKHNNNVVKNLKFTNIDNIDFGDNIDDGDNIDNDDYKGETRYVVNDLKKFNVP